MTTPYEQAYEPPAPIIEVHLAAPGLAETAGPFAALIDTGADTSLVPKSILLALARLRYLKPNSARLGENFTPS